MLMLEPQFTPFPVLQTGRLLLRRPGREDAAALFALRRNEEVMRYIDRPRPQSIDEIFRFLERMQTGLDENNSINWSICRHESANELIGMIGFHRIEKENYRAEIGYLLHPTSWRQGLMSEAMTAVIRYGFDSMHLHSIEANVNPENIGSAALLKKHGFIQEAYFRENYFFDGHFLDSMIFSLVNNK